MTTKPQDVVATVDISGFGGSYEWGCQTMLAAGENWLVAHPDFDFSCYKGFQNVYGVLIPDKESAGIELDRAIIDAVKEQGATGAMHQAVVGHLFLIHRDGRDAWLASCSPARIFQFDGTVDSCPQTTLSCSMDSPPPPLVPTEWDFNLDDNTNTACMACGRIRISLCMNGKHRCEKCDYSPEEGRVITDDEIDGPQGSR